MKLRLLGSIGGVASLWWGAAPAAGQTVNAEALSKNAFEPGFGGSVTSSLALSQGNISLLDVSGSLTLQYLTLHEQSEKEKQAQRLPFLKHRGLFVTNARNAERDDSTFFNQAFAHLRYTGMFNPRIGPDIFAQYQFNEFLRINTRFVAGGGPRVEVVHEPTFQVSLATTYMFEFEQLDEEFGTTDDLETTAHRSNNYFVTRVSALDDTVLIQHTVYYQPRFDRWRDYRILNDIEVDIVVKEWLTVGGSLSERYDSRPPTNVSPLDLRLSSNAKIVF
ncbi:MAG: DUF481 domain-containing protein [Myxococcota bacterium]